MENNSIINIGITLSDIPKDKIINHSNGKKYINLTITAMKSPDSYNNTHTCFIQQTKEEREAKIDRVYLGKGKEFIFGNKPVSTAVSEEDDNDFPF